MNRKAFDVIEYGSGKSALDSVDEMESLVAGDSRGRSAKTVFSYDLSSRYDYWNSKVFGGELERVPVRWATLKNAGGLIRAKRNRIDNKIVIDEIVISNTFKKDDVDLDRILLHEMCHGYVLAVLQKNDNHGLIFESIRRRTESKSGVDIPIRDDIEKNVSEDLSAPEFIALLVNRGGGKFWMQLFVLKSFMNNNLWNVYLGWYKDYEMVAVITDDKNLYYRYKVQRAKARRWYIMTESDARRIISGGRIYAKNEVSEKMVASQKFDNCSDDGVCVGKGAELASMSMIDKYHSEEREMTSPLRSRRDYGEMTASMISENDVCKVDVGRAKSLLPPQTMKIVRDVVRQGGGFVVVEEVNGNSAYVYAHDNPMSRIVGGVEVPLVCLRKVNVTASKRENVVERIASSARDFGCR